VRPSVLRAILATAVLAASATTVTTIRISSAGAQLPNDALAYRRLVDEYRSGSSTVHSDSAWLSHDPSRTVNDVVHPSSGWPVIELTAAAMLHTDACLELIRARRRSDALIHLDLAIRLLTAAIERDPDRTQFARRWHDVVAGLLHALGAPDIASNLRARAMTWLPETASQVAARTAFEDGLTSEIQAAAAGPLSGRLPKRTLVVPTEARSALRAAARHFERALREDPGCREAALHLGRVRLLEGREPEAERWLRLASAAHHPSVRYLAIMFLGVIAERQGRYGDAEAQYRSALESFRWGQSAPLALSHVLMRTGREAEARQTLAAHFAGTLGRVVEPLWTYLIEPSAHLAPTLNQLRAEIWR
jgi:tetratricopeptide (TPR) repeat protein